MTAAEVILKSHWQAENPSHAVLPLLPLFAKGDFLRYSFNPPLWKRGEGEIFIGNDAGITQRIQIR
jgi:hypothetical protein